MTSVYISSCEYIIRNDTFGHDHEHLRNFSLVFILPLDNDECTLGTDDCDTQATCTNNPGSFECGCKTGYNGDGVTCTGMYLQL